ncbi:MAG: hypothetical protein EXS37_01470 [Opitutus sp.]|nr:hypothetical protein [Opitutus sp.]
MRRSLLAVLCLWAPALPVGAAGILDWLLPKHDIQVITVTDTTPEGALRRRPSAANPVYYMAVNAGYREFGGSIAGEKIPPKEEVLKTIAKVLAKQGYLPGTNEHPPALLLLWTWGTMNTDRMYMGGDDTEGRQVNRRQLLRFMGAYKLGLISKEGSAFQDEMSYSGMMFKDVDSEMISDLATEDLYVAAISAYDFAAAARSKKELLWTTKISCPSRGLSLPETLPVMLALAGPNIGRETPKPVSVTATEKFKTEVKIGDPTVVEYLEQNKVPVIEMAPPDAKKQKEANAPKQKKK